MDLKERAVTGALGGAGGTLVLSGLREVFKRAGLVFDTAPVQVVDRIEELGLLGDLSPGAHRALTAAAHCAYGIGTGTVFGLLRRQSSEPAEEAAAGSALGVLAWGAGGLAGCRSPASTRLPGPRTRLKSCCPSWIMRYSARRGALSIGRSPEKIDRPLHDQAIKGDTSWTW